MRVNQCKDRQAQVEAELRFTNLVDQVPVDQVSTLSKERRYNFLSKCVRESDKFDPDKVYATFKSLMRVVEEEYVRQMKKCIILKEMQNPLSHTKYVRLKIPIRLSKKTAPYFGVVRCPKYNLAYFLNEIIKNHWSSDNDLVGMTKIFTRKCIDFQEYRYLNTNKQVLKLPKELVDIRKIQKSHHQSVQQNILIQWRDYLIGEIQDKLRKNHNFFEGHQEAYEQSALKRIISRFEYILNTYLREFVRLSIDDWVNFIKSFTKPKIERGELWKVQNTPMIVIHLSFKMYAKAKKDKDKDKDKKEKDKKKKKGEEEKKEEEEIKDDQNRIAYQPNLEKCGLFFHSALKKITNTTNIIYNLENDLMPFLQKEIKVPNFSIDGEFPWIKDASVAID
mmetsp:Transcript_43579/g.42086  ORF Transcript_43579/g.42086 Transcript_43579/m.42086 type:complete len:392 (-) Transcript_43579:3081-4256(-)